MALRIAIEGCCHGALDSIYRAVPEDVELLIICGDFQALRNKLDLQAINVPPKYLSMGDFPQYYLGEKVAPVLTIFVGGNHENSLYLRELRFGGWVAPRIYYMGEYGTVWYKGLRISGVSGIYNPYSFRVAIGPSQPKYTLPFTLLTIKSAYHVTPKSHLKLLLSGAADVVVSHDWPRWVWEHGNHRQLLRHKPFFKEDMRSGKLGLPLGEEVLRHLRPRHWFSLHLHTRFTAEVRYEPTKQQRKQKLPKAQPKRNSDELDMDMDMDMDMNALGVDAEVPMKTQPKADTTKFLALDKCLPKRRFLEVMDVLVDPHNVSHPSRNSNNLYHDARAIAIHRVVEKFAQTPQWQALDPHQLVKVLTMSSLYLELCEAVDFETSTIADGLEIPENFTPVAPTLTEEAAPLQYWPNPQTHKFCTAFGIPEPLLS